MPQNDGTWTYTWEKGRQLKSMAKSGETVTFKYNSDGLRVQKVATSTGTTNYTLHGKNIVHMTQGSNSLHFFYDASNKPAIVDLNGTKYAYVHNLQGDIVAILDGNSNVVVQYKYDAWGKLISKTGSMASTLGTLNPFRYREYVFDEETGLYYLKSRFYSSVSSRFINADSLLNSNLYFYCNNQVTNCSDSNGKDAIWITDRTLFSHSSLLIQDNDGNWHYYYWGSSKGGSSASSPTMAASSNSFSSTATSSSSSGGAHSLVFVVYEKITLQDKDGLLIDPQTCTEEELVAAINYQLSSAPDTYHYGSGTYENAVYLAGDFSASHAHATSIDKHESDYTYSFLLNNCADSAIDVLLASYDGVNDPVCITRQQLTNIRDWQIHPGSMHDAIKKIVKK